MLNKRLKEIVDAAKEDLAVLDIFGCMDEIVQLVNVDREVRCKIEDWDSRVLAKSKRRQRYEEGKGNEGAERNCR